MARKKTEDLKEELQAIEKKYNENIQENRLLQDRAIAINATLTERAEVEKEKKQEGTITLKE
tara:strand:- start:615 stop:800 length:186 start_codon:yes stop_codon:yes gene_type:complete